MLRSPTYTCWHNILQRVTNPKNPGFARYGGRGLDVDPRWRSYSNFLADMGEKPDGLSIERKDNSKGYWPDNCCWATAKEQSSNRRDTRHLVVAGEKITMTEFARRCGCSWSTVQRKMQAGFTVDQIWAANKATKQ